MSDGERMTTDPMRARQLQRIANSLERIEDMLQVAVYDQGE